MSDNIIRIMNELNGIRDLIQGKKMDYSQSNLRYHSIEDIEILMSYLERDFTELETRLLNFRDNLNAALLGIVQETEMD